MKQEKSAWNSFQETGKIDDYLKYCRDRKQEMFMSASEGAGSANASDRQWDRPAGLKK